MYESERDKHVGSVIYHRLPAQVEISSPCCESRLPGVIKTNIAFLPPPVYPAYWHGGSFSPEETRGIFLTSGKPSGARVKDAEYENTSENCSKQNCEFLVKRFVLAIVCVIMFGTE